MLFHPYVDHQFFPTSPAELFGKCKDIPTIFGLHKAESATAGREKLRITGNEGKGLEKWVKGRGTKSKNVSATNRPSLARMVRAPLIAYRILHR